MHQFNNKSTKLNLILGEKYPCERKTDDESDRKESIFEVQDVSVLGTLVHNMQEDLMKAQN